MLQFPRMLLTVRGNRSKVERYGDPAHRTEIMYTVKLAKHLKWASKFWRVPTSAPQTIRNGGLFLCEVLPL